MFSRGGPDAPRRSATSRGFGAKPLDLPGQLGAPAIDTRFYRAFGDTEPLGDFLVRQLMNVAQQHSRAERRREAAEPFSQQPDPVLRLNARVRAGPGRFGLHGGR